MAQQHQNEQTKSTENSSETSDALIESITFQIKRNLCVIVKPKRLHAMKHNNIVLEFIPNVLTTPSCGVRILKKKGRQQATAPWVCLQNIKIDNSYKNPTLEFEVHEKNAVGCLVELQDNSRKLSIPIALGTHTTNQIERFDVFKLFLNNESIPRWHFRYAMVAYFLWGSYCLDTSPPNSRKVHISFLFEPDEEPSVMISRDEASSFLESVVRLLWFLKYDRNIMDDANKNWSESKPYVYKNVTITCSNTVDNANSKPTSYNLFEDFGIPPILTYVCRSSEDPNSTSLENPIADYPKPDFLKKWLHVVDQSNNSNNNNNNNNNVIDNNSNHLSILNVFSNDTTTHYTKHGVSSEVTSTNISAAKKKRKRPYSGSNGTAKKKPKVAKRLDRCDDDPQFFVERPNSDFTSPMSHIQSLVPVAFNQMSPTACHNVSQQPINSSQWGTQDVFNFEQTLSIPSDQTLSQGVPQQDTAQSNHCPRDSSQTTNRSLGNGMSPTTTQNLEGAYSRLPGYRINGYNGDNSLQSHIMNSVTFISNSTPLRDPSNTNVSMSPSGLSNQNATSVSLLDGDPTLDYLSTSVPECSSSFYNPSTEFEIIDTDDYSHTTSSLNQQSRTEELPDLSLWDHYFKTLSEK
jgi:hypothetical protein